MKVFLILVAVTLCISSCSTQKSIGAGPECHPEINKVIADVLDQSLDRDGQTVQLPDYDFASQYGYIFLFDEIDENECRIDDQMLSESAKEKYRLLDKHQLNSETRRHGGKLVYMRVSSVEVDKDVARIYIGASIKFSPGRKAGALCCCGGEMILKASGDKWVFQDWGMVICS